MVEEATETKDLEDSQYCRCEDSGHNAKCIGHVPHSTRALYRTIHAGHSTFEVGPSRVIVSGNLPALVSRSLLLAASCEPDRPDRPSGPSAPLRLLSDDKNVTAPDGELSPSFKMVWNYLNGVLCYAGENEGFDYGQLAEESRCRSAEEWADMLHYCDYFGVPCKSYFYQNHLLIYITQLSYDLGKATCEAKRKRLFEGLMHLRPSICSSSTIFARRQCVDAMLATAAPEEWRRRFRYGGGDPGRGPSLQEIFPTAERKHSLARFSFDEIKDASIIELYQMHVGPGGVKWPTDSVYPGKSLGIWPITSVERLRWDSVTACPGYSLAIPLDLMVNIKPSNPLTFVVSLENCRSVAARDRTDECIKVTLDHFSLLSHPTGDASWLVSTPNEGALSHVQTEVRFFKQTVKHEA